MEIVNAIPYKYQIENNYIILEKAFILFKSIIALLG